MPKKLHKNVCEESVFSVLYNKYSADLYAFLHYKYGETLGPNDKMQDAFIKLLTNCKDISPEKAKSYVYTVATNMMRNEIKHHNVVLRHQQIKPKEYTNESPEFLLEHEQFFENYQKALERLTEDQRVSFLMNKVEGKKHTEIAEILGITKKAVENRIYKAYSILKNELEGFK